MSIQLSPIGTLITPFQHLSDCPNNIDINGPKSAIQLFPQFVSGLKGLMAGQKVLLLYWFEQSDRTQLLQRSRSSGVPIGCFALRSPHRPNPIAAATVTIDSICENELTVHGLDCLTGTYLLDIKPAI